MTDFEGKYSQQYIWNHTKQWNARDTTDASTKDVATCRADDGERKQEEDLV